VRRAVPTVAVLAGLAALALAGCGVPVGGSPVVLANRQVNPGALAPQTAPTRQGTQTWIYVLTASGTPTPVERYVPPDLCTSYAELLDRLVQGPDSQEEEDGFYSAIPGGTEVLSVAPRAVTAKPTTTPITVDFTSSFGDVTGEAQVLAVEQVVYTIDLLDPSAQVIFEIDGQPTEVPVSSGAQVPRAVSAADYPTVNPLPSPC
jgi:spore germination protein GerM